MDPQPPTTKEAVRYVGVFWRTHDATNGMVLISICIFFLPSASAPNSQSDTKIKEPTPPQGKRYPPFIFSGR